MTDAEIVARALREAIGVACYCATWPYCDHQVDASTAAVVAALTEAGRLVPEGCVAIDAGRWERVRRYADVVLDGALCSGDGDVFLTGESHDAMLALMSGDLDAEPTP